MEEQIKNCRIILGDNMEYMKNIPDKYYGLCVVDPPYGLGIDGQKKGTSKNPKHNRKEHSKKNWDSSIPSKEYFEELFRISKNQIIWGANYFVEHLTEGHKGWIVWDKGQHGLTMSDCELAYSSFDVPTRVFVKNRVALLQDGTIHPTQKPIKLYEWIYINYAEKGMKILDTHLGSGSSAIAAYRVGMDLEFTGIEIDEEYYNNAVKRIKWETSQGSLF